MTSSAAKNVFESERFEEERCHGFFVRLADDFLDDSPQHAEAGLAVGGPDPERGDQLQLGQLRHKAGQGVIPHTGVEEKIPGEARRVVEEVQHRYVRRGLLVREDELPGRQGDAQETNVMPTPMTVSAVGTPIATTAAMR